MKNMYKAKYILSALLGLLSLSCMKPHYKGFYIREEGMFVKAERIDRFNCKAYFGHDSQNITDSVFWVCGVDDVPLELMKQDSSFVILCPSGSIAAVSKGSGWKFPIAVWKGRPNERPDSVSRIIIEPTSGIVRYGMSQYDSDIRRVPQCN